MDLKEAKVEIIKPDGEAKGIRLDVWLTAALAGTSEDVSRSFVKKLIDEGLVSVNGRTAKAGYKITGTETVRVELPEPESSEIQSEDIDLKIIYEDEYLVVIDKPRGMVVHPAAGNKSGTMVNALMHHFKENLSDLSGPARPGIVHRLDKDTSGVIVVAKTNRVHRALVSGFKERSIKKIYYAVVDGIVKDEQGKIDAPIGRHPADRKKMAVNTVRGRKAVTYFKVLKRFNSATMVEVRIETGRTHQIRVHMAFIGHPVIGDPVYGRKGAKDENGINGQLLHAGLIGFYHPVTGQYMEFKSPLPDYFKEAVDRLNCNI